MNDPELPEFEYILLVVVLLLPFALIAIWTFSQWR
jgi:hypothetical protein